MSYSEGNRLETNGFPKQTKFEQVGGNLQSHIVFVNIICKRKYTLIQRQHLLILIFFQKIQMMHTMLTDVITLKLRFPLVIRPEVTIIKD